MNTVMNTLKQVERHQIGSIRFHVCEAYMYIAFGLLRLYTGDPDSEDKFSWAIGLPAQSQLPEAVLQFLTTIIFPHYQSLVDQERDKKVMEKMLLCLRAIAEEMGPASFE